MSRHFGEIRQIAFVVRDLEQALRYWTETLGVGPFFVFRDISPENFVYRGKPSPPPTLSIAVGNSGKLQVELIEQHDDRPSAYRDFLAAGNEGFQHVSSWLSRSAYDETRKRLLESGHDVLHEGVIPGAGVRFAYFGTDRVPGGLVYEIADVLDENVYPLMEQIADAALEWDGKEPVRELPLNGGVS